MILRNIPKDVQTDFLRETQSDHMPEIRREGANVIFPAFVRETGGGFRYFEISVPFSGQNLSDYNAFALKSYADLRKAFYGSWEVQMEQQLKGTFTAHQYAVRLAFPRSRDESIAAVERFAAIKAAFWATVDDVADLLGKTRADFPSGAYSSELLVWCAQNGLSDAQTADLAVKFCATASDLARLGRNWNELFDAEEEA